MMRRSVDVVEPATDEPTPRRLSIPWRRLAPGFCWLLIAGCVAFTFMRVFGLEHTWFLDTVVAFTPYLTLISVVPLIFALVLRRWRATVVALLTCLALVSLFVPRAIGQPDPGHGPTLRVMSSNMKIGAADPNAIIALVRSHHIDLLAVEEFTPEADDRLAAAGLAALLPFSATSPIEGAAGSAIYSRYPLSDTGYRPLADGFGQEFATVTVPGALPLVVEAVHTRAPNLPSSNAGWAKSIEQQPRATPKGAVRLLAGDFNATLDHSRLRTLLDTGYVDVASQLGDGLTTTWPFDGRLIPAITLDHFFADPRIGSVSFGASVVRGTDHKAIFAVITLPPR